jgi:sialidase-1
MARRNPPGQYQIPLANRGPGQRERGKLAMLPTASLLCVLLTIILASTAHAEGLFEESRAVQRPRTTYGYRGIMGDFVQLKDGSLLMSYTDGDILAVRSTDGGRTWGEPRVLVARPQPPLQGGIGCPSFLRLANGDLMVTYLYNTYPTTPYYGQNYCRRSTDEGQTWSEALCYSPHPGYLPIHNDRLQILSTGRLLAVAEYKAYLPSSDDHSGYVGMTFFSDDGGFTWQPSKNTVDMWQDDQHVEVQEADVVELKDGRLLMFARTYSGWPVFAYSSDKGETWGPPIPRKDIPMPYAGFPTVKRIPATGDLLFIWISERSFDRADPKITRRCTLTAAISKDEGETLVNPRNLASNSEEDYGYQCVEFLPDGVALVAYHDREGIRVARIGIEWFYGK